jgi:purine-binding chemotaxis protein CheW
LEVVATVPSVQLQPSCATGSKWIGVVPYLGQEVPAVDDLSLLGLSGRAAEAPSGAIVILQFNEQHLLGLKIDHVRRILSLRKNAIRSLPEALGERLSLFEGAVVDHEGLQNLLLDRRALVDCEPLRMVAALCRKADTAEHGREIGRHGAGSAGELEPFVVFRTGGRRRAAPLASVRQIIPYPAKLTGARQSGSAMKGIATYNGAPLPLLDAAGADATAGADDRMVMVVEKKGSYSGLVVEKLETIARTAMQRRPGPSEQGQFIQASVAGQPIAVPVCDLFEEVDRLAELEPLSR